MTVLGWIVLARDGRPVTDMRGNVVLYPSNTTAVDATDGFGEVLPVVAAAFLPLPSTAETDAWLAEFRRNARPSPIDDARDRAEEEDPRDD